MGAKEWLIITGICLPAIVTYAELIERKNIKLIITGVILSIFAAVATFYGYESIVNVFISLYIIGIFSRIIIQTVSVHKFTVFNAVCALVMVVFIEGYPRALSFVENLSNIADDQKSIYSYFILVFLFFIPIINLGLINMSRDSAREYLEKMKKEQEEKEQEEKEKEAKEANTETKNKSHKNKKKKKSKKKK